MWDKMEQKQELADQTFQFTKFTQNKLIVLMPEKSTTYKII